MNIFLLIYTFILNSILPFCQPQPDFKTEDITGVYQLENQKTTIKYYNTSGEEIELTEINKDSFYAGGTDFSDDFDLIVQIMEGNSPTSEMPSLYINRIGILDTKQLYYHVNIPLSEDSLLYSIECSYKKLSPGEYQSDLCTMDQFGPLIFYYENNIISQYSQVILTSTDGGTFKSSFVDGEYSSLENMNQVIVNYFKNKPHLNPGEKIAIAHIKRNYIKLQTTKS